MAKKTSFVVVVVIALLTIYGRWCKIIALTLHG